MVTYNDSYMAYIYSVSDGIRLGYGNENLNQKLYYRIYGFEPSNSTAKVGKTQKDAKNFILNTDYNYCKLYKKGIVTSDSTILHNLGYKPFVLAWEEYEPLGTITPCWISGGTEDGFAEISTTPTSVKISVVQPNTKIHYRIYYDEV